MQDIKWHQSAAGRPIPQQEVSGLGERNTSALPAWALRAATYISTVLIRSPLFTNALWLLILSALALGWWVSLSVVDVRSMGELGLLMVLPRSIYLIFVALTISYALAIRAQAPRAIMLLHLALLVLMIHGTPHLLYGTLRYSWAWKHIGLIDYIQQYRTLDLDNTVLGAYHNWPGFFTVNAFLTQVAGLESSVSYGGWAPVFFNLLNIGALLLIFRASTHDERLIWLATWFFVLANWVGQDYFSPQAMNYFLHLVIIGCILWWFRQTRIPTRAEVRRWLPTKWRISDWLVDRIDYIFARAKNTEPPSRPNAKAQRTGILLLMVVVLAAINSSHQLTPFMTIASLAALVVFQRTNAHGMLFLAGVLTATWLAYGASNYMQVTISELIASVIQVQETLDTGFISLSDASFAQQLIAIMGRILTVGIWGLGMLGALRRLRNGHWDLAILVLAAAPLSILAGGAYGGEVLFRVYFFTLPFIVFLGAAFFMPTPSAGRSWLTSATIIVVSLAMLVGLGFAYYGKDQQYYFTPEEIAAADYLDSVAPPGSLIVEGNFNYPLRFRNHTQGTVHVAFVLEPPEALAQILADPETVFLQWMTDSTYPASYMILTRSMASEVDMLGQMPPGALDMIKNTLRESPYFKVLYSNRDATIFVVDDAYWRARTNLNTGQNQTTGATQDAQGGSRP